MQWCVVLYHILLIRRLGLLVIIIKEDRKVVFNKRKTYV